MKKILLLLFIILLLTGCTKQGDINNNIENDSKHSGNQKINNDENNTDEDKKDLPNIDKDNSSDNEQNDDNTSSFVFKTNNILISMNEDATSILEKLGQAIDTFEAPSCAFKGMDQFYVYPGYELSTYPLNGSNYISSIDFIDDTVSTSEGITIGLTLDDLISKYGDNYIEEGNMFTYTKADSKINFIVVDGYIENITYIALANE